MISLPYTHKLKHPIQLTESQVIFQVEIKSPPTVATMYNLGASDPFDRSVKIVERLTAQPPVVIQKMHVEDFTELSEIVNDFFPTGRKGGSEQSAQ
jgi:hypothetical protein